MLQSQDKKLHSQEEDLHLLYKARKCGEEILNYMERFKLDGKYPSVSFNYGKRKLRFNIEAVSESDSSSSDESSE